MTHPEPFDREVLEGEILKMLDADADAINHALVCPSCSAQEIALRALALAGLTEDDWWYRIEAQVRGLE